MAECCPICCTEYQAHGEHARIICSGRCRTFSMCRLCVHRQATFLAQPFVVDDDTGDFTTLDPTKCPQCNESGAFRDGELPSLSDEIMATEEEQVRRRRDDVANAALERALSRLNDAPPVRLDPPDDEMLNVGMEVEGDVTFRTINGSSDTRLGSYGLSFGSMSSVGVPRLFCRSGVLYFEVNASCNRNTGYIIPNAHIGFSLADGMMEDNVIVGHDYKSWGLDLIYRGMKSSHGEFYGSKVKPDWSNDDIIGVAVNVDKGMIAVSTNGSWELTDGNGVKFEEEKIQAGVYPVASASNCWLSWRFNDLRYGPPPESLWDIWPKFEDIHWINLPIDARAAALRLGYTQFSWGGSGDNPIEEKKWDELSSEEQSAANVLGYNEGIWAHIMSAENDEDSDDDSYDGDDSDSENDRIESFSELRWESLPSDAKRAAEILHFTQSSWDEDVPNPLMEEEWEELTDEQKRAAILLGYDENTWHDGCLIHGSSNNSSSSSDLPFDHMYWEELPRDAREAAIKLGYTAQLWNNDEPGPLEDTKFDYLTEEQQFACAALGYVKTTWDFNVNKRLFIGMDMTDAFEAMQTISVIMSNLYQNRGRRNV